MTKAVRLSKAMLTTLAVLMLTAFGVHGQINTDQVMRVGQNALYFEDYMVAIQYFNQVIGAKPYLAQPYFYRAIAKISLDDFAGAEADASAAIEKNPFITDAYEVRGVARQNLGKNLDAIEDYNRVLVDKPDSRGVLYNKAMAEVDTKNFDAAERSFTKLIGRYPNYDGGYLARARFRMIEGDTIAALADLDKAIELNANSANAYILRAEIALQQRDDYAGALPDMDMAIRLLPQSAGLYINRAFLRYRNDDYVGAMADYDYALSLDPSNIVALYNRGMLRAEVHDLNNAIEDFSAVINQQPHQYRAVFNRANLYREIGDWNSAYRDINTVIDAFPTFAAAIYLRGEIQYHRGNNRAAERDFNQSIALARKKVVMLPDSDIGAAREVETNDTTGIFAESQEAVSERFSSLLRVENMCTTPREFNNGSTRGQIQNTDFAIKLEPLYMLTFYMEPTELKMSSDFVREVDALNRSHILALPLLVAVHEPTLTDDDFNRHTSSIEAYNSYLKTDKARPVDYFGRGMDYMTLRNYEAAISDFDHALESSPDFTLALLMRAVARWKGLEAQDATPGADHGKDAAMLRRVRVNAALADLDAAIALSPMMAIAWYDKGVIYAAEADYKAALEAFNRAITLKDDLGEAYYNRGYVNMMLGNKSEAFADLSRAGQLGIAPSYNLIKRMSR